VEIKTSEVNEGQVRVEFNARGDIGNWAEPSGVLALLVEAGFAVLAVMQLRRDGAVQLLTLRSDSDKSTCG
jgi:hypothetical protein